MDIPYVERVFKKSALAREKIMSELETTIVTKHKMEGEKKIKKMKVKLPKIKTKHHLPQRLTQEKSITSDLSLDDPRVNQKNNFF